MILKNREAYIGAGLALGAAVGAATDNVGLWLSLGLCIGAALYAASETPDDDDAKKDEGDSGTP